MLFRLLAVASESGAKWEVAVFELNNPSSCQNITERNLKFLDEKQQNRPSSTTWNQVLTHRWEILIKICLYSFRSDTLTAKDVSELKGYEEPQNFEVYFPDEESVLAFCTTDVEEIFEICAGNDYGVMLRGKKRQSQSLFTTLFAHTLSGYTQNWLFTILLVTERIHCCVVLLFFHS